MDATRRLLLLALSATPAIALARRWPASGSPGTFEAEVRRLEGASGGRLGVALFDSGSGDRFAYRGDERFPMCSTFKLLLAAAVLRRTEQGKESLSRRIAVRPGALVSWSPFTEKRVGGEASVEELCAAAMTLSDNTAANLLLATIGGPAGIGAFARTLGDESTRLDRMETALNSATPGDLRDTTTPLAMLGNLRELLLGDALGVDSRERLLRWMRANTTGGDRLRAGLPPQWQIGDKTGSGAKGTTNDIAILWPPGGKPLLVCAYLTRSTLDSAKRDAIHASLAMALSAR
jgi:beta-lactamase class A